MGAPQTTSPTEIRRNGTAGLTITWHDGTSSSISSETLRRNCPCASCKELRGDTSHSAPLTSKKKSLMVIQNSVDTEIALQQIWGVGQYALGMSWGDGHDSGIYPFQLLRELGQMASS